jgi:hypothetical protein
MALIYVALSAEARYNIAMNLTVRPVTHLAGSSGQQQTERERARCVPVQPAGYRGRYAHSG